MSSVRTSGVGCSGCVQMISVFCTPSLWGMFVYRDDTSMDARKQCVGSFVVSISCTKSVESFRYDGSLFTSGCSHLSTNWDMGSVILLQLETMGLIPIGFLWILF